MKVACVLSSLSRANGGVSESVRRLAQSLPPAGADRVSVYGLRDRFTDEDLPLWRPLTPRDLAVRGPAAIGYAPDLSAALREDEADVSHAAGLWMYPSVAHHRAARARKRPYLVSPHGMLDPWALRHSAWKKNLAAALFERAHLHDAACLHALCAAEAESIRAYGLRKPVCILPNGVDLPADLPPAPSPWADRVPAGRRVLLFLGRLHPKKGLVNLLTAWPSADARDWQLVVAGWDQGGHRAELEALCAARGLADRVTFIGPVHGPAKAAAYASAHGFILPSFSEGLPMTILEAWAACLPVLMTTACNLPEGFAAGAAREIDTDPGKMARTLLEFMQAGDADRSAMGRRGRALVEKQFNWTRIAAEMLAVYRWVCGRGPQPSCVHI